MAVYKVRDPEGNIREISGPDGASDADIVAQAKRLFTKAKSDVKAQIDNDAISKGAKDFNADSGFLSNVAAGAGKAVSDVGLGVRQMFGKASQGEVDDAAKRDKALMGTGGGLLGNIGTQAGMALLPGGAAVRAGNAMGAPMLAAAGKLALSTPATLTGAGVGAGMGAAQAALQPVQTGDSRAGNAAFGAVAGAAVPVAGMALKGGKAMLEPLYAGGRDVIVGRTMNEAAGSGRDAVVKALQGARELVPGSAPTAAEVAENGGIAALQRAATQANPEAYAQRGMEQAGARVNALRGIAGDVGQREMFDAARQTTAKELYDKAYEKGIDLTRDATTGAFLSKAQQAARKGEITKMMNTPAMQEAAAQARKLMLNDPNLRGKVLDPAGSVQGLDYTRRALSDMIGEAKPGSNQQRILVSLKERLDTTLDNISPSYGEARRQFAEMSKPINQMDVGKALLDKMQPALAEHGALARETGNSFANALRNEGETVARNATGMRKGLADIMEPEQMSTINAIAQDLARKSNAQELGRGVGSNTFQNLAMDNIMKRSGLPGSVGDIPGVGRGLSWVYDKTDGKMRERMAEALLNPQQSAELMQGAVPSEARQRIADLLMMAGKPLAIGTGMGALNGAQ